MKQILVVISGILCLVAYTVLVLGVAESHRGKELFRSEQPATVQYHSFDPYLLTVVEGPIRWTMLGWPRSIIIGLTRSRDDHYGHFIDMNLPAGTAGELAADWSEAGVILRFPSGHTLDIPKTAFIGCR